METLPFALAKDLAMQLLSLALALVGLTITFVKDFDVRGIKILAVSWALLAGSIIFGVFHLMAITGQAAEISSQAGKFKGFAGSVLMFAQLQVLLFAVGFAALIFFGYRQKQLELRKKDQQSASSIGQKEG